MADPQDGKEEGDGPRVKPGCESPPPAPLWVKVSAVILVVMIPLVVVLHLTGNSPVGHGH